MRFWATFANRPAVFLNARDPIEAYRKARRMGFLSTIERVRDHAPHGDEPEPGSITWLDEEGYHHHAHH